MADADSEPRTAGELDEFDELGCGGGSEEAGAGRAGGPAGPPGSSGQGRHGGGLGEREVADDRPVYGISVAAELVGVEPRSLRHFERRGLIHPARTSGGTRRYSGVDVRRGQRIGGLLGDGLNLAGIELVLRLEAELAALRAALRGRPSGPRDDRPDDDRQGDADTPHDRPAPGRAPGT